MNEQLQNIIDEVAKDGHTLEITSAIKSGKEAEVYQVLFDSVLCAMKVYKKPEERSFKNNDQYLSGKFYKHKSHRKAIAKGSKFGKDLKHHNWISREFLILNKLYKAEASIPKPILQVEDAIIMEYLGDLDGAAVRLVDIELDKTSAESVFQTILNNIKLFYKIGIVHGDLSPYNVLCWNDQIFIIDFPQSIDIRNYPNSWEILERDLTNIISYFKKYIEIDEEKIKEEFKQIT